MPDQCRAVTEDGERCSRPAEEDGFCHQHGPDDETVDDADSTETTDDADDSEDAQMDENDTQNGSDDDESRQTDDGDTGGSDGAGENESDADESGSDTDESRSDGDRTDIVTIRNTVQQDVPALISHDLDGVTSLVREEDGWTATVEMVERHSVPDTQDILGHYEISLSDQADILGYRRLETYRRADGPPYEG